MSRFRRLLVHLTVIGLAVTIACLLQAESGEVSWMRYASYPLFALSFAAWWLAIDMATRIADSDSAVVFPGLKQLVGLWLAVRHAPVWALVISASSLVSLSLLGGSGSVSGLPHSPDEAKIIGTVFVAFLAVSLPALSSSHPSINVVPAA
jgi:hypothetical protein